MMTWWKRYECERMLLVEQLINSNKQAQSVDVSEVVSFFDL